MFFFCGSGGIRTRTTLTDQQILNLSGLPVPPLSLGDYLVRPEGLEPSTPWLKVMCIYQLSYERIKKKKDKYGFDQSCLPF